MKAWSRRRTWLAGLAILVLTNAIALAGAAYNRRGEPEAVLTLTERELGVPYRSGFARESSGISLRLQWRVVQEEVGRHYFHTGRWNAAEWLDRAKLTALGFEVPTDLETAELRRRFGRSLPREAFLVLEYDGPAYQTMLDRVRAYRDAERALAGQHSDEEEFKRRAKDAERRWRVEQQSASRLFVVDAGLSPEGLRKQYPDRRRYLIAAGKVRANIISDGDDDWRAQGYIEALAVPRVNVPAGYHKLFDALPARHDLDDPPRFRLELAYGRRFEPWIRAVEPMGD